MTKSLLFTGLLALGGGDAAPVAQRVAERPRDSLPADVVAFRTRRDACDSLRGEEPTDAARAAFLERALTRACAGTDAELAALKRRHAARPAVRALLARYDPAIE